MIGVITLGVCILVGPIFGDFYLIVVMIYYLQAMEAMNLRGNEGEDTTMEGSYVPDGLMVVDGIRCLGYIDFNALTPEDVKQIHFSDLEAAYDFYNEYERMKGFSIRRPKVGLSSNEDIFWQTFLCCREGQRESKYPEEKRAEGQNALWM